MLVVDDDSEGVAGGRPSFVGAFVVVVARRGVDVLLVVAVVVVLVVVGLVALFLVVWPGLGVALRISNYGLRP